MQHSYVHPWIWGHLLPHVVVTQFSHSHNCVKSKPTDVNAERLRSPTAKHLYIWEVLMCDINILPSTATMYTKTSEAISIIRTETHAHRHIYRIFSSVFLHECNHCAGRSRTRGDSPSPLHTYCCFKWENTLWRNSEQTIFSGQQIKNCNIFFNKVFFFNATGWWRGHEKEGNRHIFSMRAVRVPWVDSCYEVPSSASQRAELACTGRKKQSNKLVLPGTISFKTYCFPPEELGRG